MNMQDLKNTDYYLLYQTNGVSFLFATLCTRYYDRFNGVALSLENEWRYYVRLEERTSSKQAYESFYRDFETIAQSDARFLTTKDSALAFRERMRGIDHLDLGTFDEFIDLNKILMDEYSKSDHMYTDFLFEDTRPEAKEMIDIVERRKNVYREYMDELYFVDDSCLSLIIGALSKEKGIPAGELWYSSEDEIRDLIATGRFAPHGENGDDHVIVRHDGEYAYLRGTDATQFGKEFIAEEDFKTIKELKGITVSKQGVYRGKVKRVYLDYTRFLDSLRELDAMEPGSILVTDSTTPEMLVAMKKAAAIVTDMGGMLSHAAITARELDIPCVIGTKDATRILKDGDLVEVDADHGIVRILS